MKTAFIILCIVALCLAQVEKQVEKGKEKSKDSQSGNQGSKSGQQNGNKGRSSNNQQGQGGSKNENQGSKGGKQSQDGNQGSKGGQQGQSSSQNGNQNSKSGQQGQSGSQNGNQNSKSGKQSQDGNQGQQGGNKGKGGPQNNQQGESESRNGKQGKGSHEHGQGRGGENGGKPMGPWSIPGCNITTFPKEVKPTDCCPSLPKISHDDLGEMIDEKCKKECPKSDDRKADRCCKTKCAFAALGLTNSDGSFNIAGAVAQINNRTSNPTAWAPIIKTSVEACAANGSKMAEEWSKKTNRTDTCGNGNIMATIHCIARQLFVQCPASEAINTNESCPKLFAFANACPAFPFPDRKAGPGHHGKGGHSGEKSKNDRSTTPGASPTNNAVDPASKPPQSAKGGNAASKKPEDNKKGNTNQNKPSQPPKKN